MVAPLDVGALVRAAQQAIHDLRGAATAIEDVTHQVDVVDGEYFDKFREGEDEVFSGVGFQDRVDDALVVAHAVVVLVRVRVQQLVDDVGEVMRDGLAHLGASVAAG